MKQVSYGVSLRSRSDHVIGPNGLLATKARVVVTNSIHFLKHFDHICYVRRGVILESGTYAELVTNPERELHKLVYVSFVLAFTSLIDRTMSVGRDMET